MDTITQKLLAIESEAQGAMNALAKEKTRLAQKTQEELKRRMADVEFAADQEILQMRQLAEAEAVERISQIQADYIKKTEDFSEKLEAGKQTLRDKIIHDVLYGEL